jgi:hypothetical protein
MTPHLGKYGTAENLSNHIDHLYVHDDTYLRRAFAQPFWGAVYDTWKDQCEA